MTADHSSMRPTDRHALADLLGIECIEPAAQPVIFGVLDDIEEWWRGDRELHRAIVDRACERGRMFEEAAHVRTHAASVRGPQQ